MSGTDAPGELRAAAGSLGSGAGEDPHEDDRFGVLVEVGVLLMVALCLVGPLKDLVSEFDLAPASWKKDDLVKALSD